MAAKPADGDDPWVVFDVGVSAVDDKWFSFGGAQAKARASSSKSNLDQSQDEESGEFCHV